MVLVGDLSLLHVFRDKLLLFYCIGHT